MAFIEVSGVSKSFTSAAAVKHVLHDVSLSVERGRFVSIVGAMDGGKSTLLSLLAGLTVPVAGTVTIDGAPVTGIRRDAAFVCQNYSLLPWFTALENVRLAVDAALPDLTRDEQRAQAQRALEQVGLGNAIHRRPSQLSGGMRQRVAIARAFATRPQVLFLDEPFGALDALTRETLQQDLARLCSAAERPVTTVMITNSVEEAMLLSDAIVPIVAGPPATLGTPIPVELPRPRSIAQLAHDEQATHVRAHVVATLTSARQSCGASHSTPSRRRDGDPAEGSPARTREGSRHKRDTQRTRRNSVNVPLELTGLTKVFPTPSGPFIAVKDVNATRCGGPAARRLAWMRLSFLVAAQPRCDLRPAIAVHG